MDNVVNHENGNNDNDDVGDGVAIGRPTGENSIDANNRRQQALGNNGNGNAYDDCIHQTTNRTNNSNPTPDIIHKADVVQMLHQQTKFTFNNSCGGARAIAITSIIDSDDSDGDVNEHDSLLGASKVNFISLV